MKQSLKDKVVVITGASSGIGLAAAKAFAAEGSKLAVAARNIEKLNKLKEELSQNEIICIKTDVTIEGECQNLIEQTITKYGRIDILINNAGISMRAMFKDLNLSVIKNLMDVNFWGTVYCTKYALPWILETRGSVVGVISIAGFKGLPARTGYSASKFAVYGFLDTLRIEHLKENLHVMIFAPGFTASSIREKALVADGTQQGSTPRDEDKMMSAEECAQHLVKGIKKRKSQVILTFIGKLTVNLNKFFPRLVDRLEYSFMKKEPDSPLK